MFSLGTVYGMLAVASGVTVAFVGQVISVNGVLAM